MRNPIHEYGQRNIKTRGSHGSLKPLKVLKYENQNEGLKQTLDFCQGALNSLNYVSMMISGKML